MTAKTDAHHVVDFALVPVDRAPHANDAGQFGFFLAHVGLEAQFTAGREAAQFINHRPARVVAVIVEAAHVHEIIEAKLLLAEFAHGDDLFRVGNFDRDFATKLRRFGDQIAELFLQFLRLFQKIHNSEKLTTDGHG